MIRGPRICAVLCFHKLGIGGSFALCLVVSCRIDRVVSDDNRVVLVVSGRITGEHIDTLRGVLEQESGGFAIDLNVLLVDREAVTLLAFTEANGTELRNCPPYIREWVTRWRAERTGACGQELEGREDI